LAKISRPPEPVQPLSRSECPRKGPFAIAPRREALYIERVTSRKGTIAMERIAIEEAVRGPDMASEIGAFYPHPSGSFGNAVVNIRWLPLSAVGGDGEA